MFLVVDFSLFRLERINYAHQKMEKLIDLVNVRMNLKIDTSRALFSAIFSDIFSLVIRVLQMHYHYRCLCLFVCTNKNKNKK